MRRRALFAVALLCAVSASAQTIDCNQTLRGTLAAGRANVHTFTGIGGQTIRAVLYPLSPALTHPTLAVTPPFGNAHAPSFSGGKGAQLETVLQVSGAWSVSVGSADPAASGDYVLQLSCRGTNAAADRQGCAYQWIVCGQTIEWSLDPTESCRFHDALDIAFEQFSFYGNAGDTLTLDVESDDFTPRLNIYPGKQGGTPIARSTPVTATKATLSFPFSTTGQIDIAVRPNLPNTFGRFKLTVRDCASAGCLQPVVDDPPDVAVPKGAPATLHASAFSFTPLLFFWSERTALPQPVGQGAAFTTPRITATRYYSFSASAPCMASDSRVIAVTPATPRRRVARN